MSRCAILPTISGRSCRGSLVVAPCGSDMILPMVGGWILESRPGLGDE
jgi:hypothetical protein